jgi:hypothetical protein
MCDLFATKKPHSTVNPEWNVYEGECLSDGERSWAYGCGREIKSKEIAEITKFISEKRIEKEVEEQRREIEREKAESAAEL